MGSGAGFGLGLGLGLGLGVCFGALCAQWKSVRWVCVSLPALLPPLHPVSLLLFALQEFDDLLLRGRGKPKNPQ